ncbi:MAG: fimbrillin family protein [Prevotella sp.]|nr:fimbrillin family protein [Prevotella sp.]
MVSPIHRTVLLGCRLLLLGLTAVLTACGSDGTEGAAPAASAVLEVRSLTVPLADEAAAKGSRVSYATGDTYLPEGTEIGVTLKNEQQTEHDYAACFNLLFTAAGSATSQTWSHSGGVAVTDETAQLSAYWPYDKDADPYALTVDAAKGVDCLYAPFGYWTSGNDPLNYLHPVVHLSMSHALSVIIINFKNNAYTSSVGAGKLDHILVSSNAYATHATLNTTAGTYSAFTGQHEVELEAEQVTIPQAGTAEAAIDTFMIVPTGKSAAMTFQITLDGKVYTVTTPATVFQKGYVYTYHLRYDDRELKLDDNGVTIAQWNYATMPPIPDMWNHWHVDPHGGYNGH